MTGKELILYILQNNLEDKTVFENGRFMGFLTISEAAVKYDVGEFTVRTWAKLGAIRSIKIEGRIYIPANEKDPREKEAH